MRKLYYSLLWYFKKKIEKYEINESGDSYKKNKALIRFYLHLNADLLNDDEYYEAIEQIRYCLKLQNGE